MALVSEWQVTLTLHPPYELLSLGKFRFKLFSILDQGGILSRPRIVNGDFLLFATWLLGSLVSYRNDEFDFVFRDPSGGLDFPLEM